MRLEVSPRWLPSRRRLASTGTAERRPHNRPDCQAPPRTGGAGAPASTAPVAAEELAAERGGAWGQQGHRRARRRWPQRNWQRSAAALGGDGTPASTAPAPAEGGFQAAVVAPYY
jgi:hypothetical protein